MTLTATARPAGEQPRNTCPIPPAPRRARSRYPPTCRGSPAASGSTAVRPPPPVSQQAQDYHRMPTTRGRTPRSSTRDSAVDDGGGDPGYMLGRPAEKLPGAVRALEVAMGVVLPGD